MKNLSGKEKLGASLPEPCGGKSWLWASWSQCTAYNQVWFLLITSEVIKEYLRTQDLYLIRSICQGGICMSSSHIMSCGHLIWWKLTFTIKFKCITLKPGVLRNSQLWIWEHVLIDATQWLCLMEQIRTWSRRNVNIQRSEYQWEAELQTLIVQARLLRTPFFFPRPMEFINRDLGESFSLSALALSLCCAFAVPFLFIWELPPNAMMFGQHRAPEKKAVCSWFSGSCHYFMCLYSPSNNYKGLSLKLQQ